jgi:hypothetical protein
MGSLIRWILKVFSVFIGLFAFLAQVGPNALKSNISEWLRSFGVTEIPRGLLSPGISFFVILLAIVMVLFPFAPWIYRQLKKLVWPLQVENFRTSDPTDLKYTVGVKVSNTTGVRLNHCTVRIENIEPSEPDSLSWIFSDSQLRLKPAEEEVFALNPRNHRGVLIAQYDSVNRFEKLGIELLCFSSQRHQAVDPRQSYIITITASAERGSPLQKQYKLWLDAAGRLCFEPADAFNKDRKRILEILRRMVEKVIRPTVRTS